MKPMAIMNGSRRAARTGGTIAFNTASESATSSARAGPLERHSRHEPGGDVDRCRQDRQRDHEPQRADARRRGLPRDLLTVGLHHAAHRCARGRVRASSEADDAARPTGARTETAVLAPAKARAQRASWLSSARGSSRSSPSISSTVLPSTVRAWAASQSSPAAVADGHAGRRRGTG